MARRRSVVANIKEAIRYIGGTRSDEEYAIKLLQDALDQLRQSKHFPVALGK